MSKHYITIIDSIGRNILGEDVTTDPQFVTIKNPVMVNVSTQNNQLQVQLIPLFMFEFITSKANGSREFTFAYSTNSVAVGSVDIDSRITSQYDRIIEALNPTAPKATAEPPVIKLFDEEVS